MGINKFNSEGYFDPTAYATRKAHGQANRLN